MVTAVVLKIKLFKKTTHSVLQVLPSKSHLCWLSDSKLRELCACSEAPLSYSTHLQSQPPGLYPTSALPECSMNGRIPAQGVLLSHLPTSFSCRPKHPWSAAPISQEEHFSRHFALQKWGEITLSWESTDRNAVKDPPRPWFALVLFSFVDLYFISTYSITPSRITPSFRKTLPLLCRQPRAKIWIHPRHSQPHACFFPSSSIIPIK